MNKKTLGLLVLAAGVAGLAYYFYAGRAASERAPVLYGNVDIREMTLAFRVAGRVAAVQVDEGARVRRGDALAALDAEPLTHALHGAEAGVAALAARNALLHRGYRSEEREQARARVGAAAAALAEADSQLRRQRELAPDGASTLRALEAAQAARAQAVAQLTVAQQQLQQLRSGFRKEELAESDAQLAQARANLEAARLALRDASLVAPGEGVILTRAIEPGTLLPAGAPAFSLSLTQPVWVRAYVAEAQLGQFASGAAVSLSTDSRPGQPYRGVVGFVSPSAEFTPKTVETADLRTALVYRLRIVVQDADAQLRQGMPVTVRLAP